MGMDVIGMQPRSVEGQYFRRTIWAWGPLWNTVSEIAPQITSKVTCGHSNDGDGLNDHDSRTLAQAIDQALADGSADTAITKALDMKLQLQTLVKEAMGQVAQNENVEVQTPVADSPVNRQDLEEFSYFLKTCGGFMIC